MLVSFVDIVGGVGVVHGKLVRDKWTKHLAHLNSQTTLK